MKIKITSKDITTCKCDAIIVNLFEDDKTPTGATGAVDKALGGAISDLLRHKEFTGKPASTAILDSRGALAARKVIVTGLGKKDTFGPSAIRYAVASAVKKAATLRCHHLATILHGTSAVTPQTAAEIISETAIISAYRFDKYFTTKDDEKDASKIVSLTIIESDPVRAAAAKPGITTGIITADAVNFARDLVNEPPNILTPAELAARAVALAKANGLKSKVLARRELEKLGMNAFLGVARGTSSDALLITIEYTGNPGSQQRMAFVGKGITFDSGGLSLKPASSMDGMKTDMAGAAAVLGAISIAAQLKLPVNITAIIPTTDNMPGPAAQQIGDVVTTFSGKTVEILNTDAEGRLLLCDAVAWAASRSMAPIIDVATLTGACIVALGHHRSGLFCNDDSLAAAITSAADTSGEPVWRMPLDDEYKPLIKSDIADIKNTGGRWAGAITGALFIQEFAGGKPWAHIDIAGPSYVEKPHKIFGKGATGAAVRTLALTARSYATINQGK